MPIPDPDILVQRFVDGDLSDDEVQDALHRIADDEEARKLLRFELEMTQDLAASQSTAPPADFADRTMAAVTAETDAAAVEADVTVSLWRRLEHLWTAATAPVSVELRPLSAAVAVLLLVGAVAWTVGPALWAESSTSTLATAPKPESSTAVHRTSASSPSQGETVWIRFKYTNNTADSVAVAGDFSQWTPVPLSPRTVNGETVWAGLVPVSRGEHEYQFVINGKRWVPDPLAPTKRGDGFGAENAVLNI